MNNEPRENVDDPNPRVEVDALDVRLPCRTFRVSYKVSEQGKLSLTTEFVLRLLRAADELKEESVGQFFGFSDDEVRFAVDQAEKFDYVERVNGRVHMTEAGRNLFNVGTDEPALFEVVSRHERANFDLISFAPVEPWRRLSDFEFALPELEVASAEAVGNASERIRQSFAKYFHVFRPKRGLASGATVHSLYTVDNVQADKRFSCLVPVKVSVRPDNPTTPEADLLSWKSGVDLDERAAVLHACGNVVRGITGKEDARSTHAGRELLRCAPDVMGRFAREENVDWGSFFRTTIRQAGKLQIDRQTVRVVGRVWVDANKERLAKAAEYAAKGSGTRPPMIIWLRPAVPNWGMTTRLVDIIEGLRHAFGSVDQDGEDRLHAVLLGDHTPDIFRHVFNATVRIPNRALSPDMEVLLVPGRLAVVLAHSPIGAADGFPVPMGLVTFEAAVVQRVHALLTERLSAPGVVRVHCDWKTEDLLDDVGRALDCLPALGDAAQGADPDTSSQD